MDLTFIAFVIIIILLFILLLLLFIIIIIIIIYYYFFYFFIFDFIYIKNPQNDNINKIEKKDACGEIWEERWRYRC